MYRRDSGRSRNVAFGRCIGLAAGESGRNTESGKAVCVAVGKGNGCTGKTESEVSGTRVRAGAQDTQVQTSAEESAGTREPAETKQPAVTAAPKPTPVPTVAPTAVPTAVPTPEPTPEPVLHQPRRRSRYPMMTRRGGMDSHERGTEVSQPFGLQQYDRSALCDDQRGRGAGFYVVQAVLRMI